MKVDTKRQGETVVNKSYSAWGFKRFRRLRILLCLEDYRFWRILYSCSEKILHSLANLLFHGFFIKLKLINPNLPGLLVIWLDCIKLYWMNPTLPGRVSIKAVMNKFYTAWLCYVDAIYETVMKESYPA